MPSQVAERQPDTSSSICFVTTDFPPIGRNGGIGTYFSLMSRLLVRSGWRVHILFCGWVEDPAVLREMPGRLASEGIGFTALDTLPQPSWVNLPHNSLGGSDIDIRSQRVMEVLSALHAEHRFDLVEFAEWQGMGFRSVQAKRLGLALEDVLIAVTLHSPSRWLREGNLTWLGNPEDLKIDFCERYAFEHADVQLSVSRYMADYARTAEWAVRDDVAFVYPFPDREGQVSPAVPIRELAFFGRLEIRKGLDLFLDALNLLDPDLPVLFMGKDTDVNGRPASSIIAERLAHRPHRIETTLDRAGALAQLRGGDRLAVMPSRTENAAFTVAECVANGVPFLATNVGAIPELLQHEEARARWLFEPTVDALVAAIERRMATPAPQERTLRMAVIARHDRTCGDDRVARTYSERVEHLRHQSAPTRRPAGSATVTVAVTHYNKAPFLAATLRSLAAQTRPPDEVIVIDDGSTDQDALVVFAEQEALHPEWTFLRQQNVGLGASINACLARATGGYFVPFDADNIATPEMLQVMLKAMETDFALAAATCHNLHFVEDDDIGRERFRSRYSPTGGPLLLSLLQNVYGDTAAIFRTEALRSVGGWETERWTGTVDWQTFMKLSVRGQRVDVIPHVLFYYRTGIGGMWETLSGPETTYRERARMIALFLAEAPLTHLERVELWECALAFGDLVGGYAGLMRAHPGARLQRRIRTPAQRVSDLRNLVAAQRAMGKPATSITRTVASALLRRQ